MLEKNKVSVVITTYKRNSSLLRAIDSVIKQSYKNFEIIVVNDCADDKLILLELLKDYDLKLIHSNSGDANSARKIGFLNSTGEFICFLDDDDYWGVDKLLFQVDLLKNNPSVILVTSNGIEFHEEKDEKSVIITSSNKNLLFYGNFIGGFSFVCLRSSFIKPNFFWLGLESGQDWFFWLKLYFSYPNMVFEHCKSYDVFYQKSVVNISNDPVKKVNGFFKVYKYIYPNLKINHIKYFNFIKPSNYGFTKCSFLSFVSSGILFKPFYSYILKG